MSAQAPRSSLLHVNKWRVVPPSQTRRQNTCARTSSFQGGCGPGPVAPPSGARKQQLRTPTAQPSLRIAYEECVSDLFQMQIRSDRSRPDQASDKRGLGPIPGGDGYNAILPAAGGNWGLSPTGQAPRAQRSAPGTRLGCWLPTSEHSGQIQPAARCHSGPHTKRQGENKAGGAQPRRRLQPGKGCALSFRSAGQGIRPMPPASHRRAAGGRRAAARRRRRKRRRRRSGGLGGGREPQAGRRPPPPKKIGSSVAVLLCCTGVCQNKLVRPAVSRRGVGRAAPRAPGAAAA